MAFKKNIVRTAITQKKKTVWKFLYFWWFFMRQRNKEILVFERQQNAFFILHKNSTNTWSYQFVLLKTLKTLCNLLSKVFFDVFTKFFQLPLFVDRNFCTISKKMKFFSEKKIKIFSEKKSKCFCEMLIKCRSVRKYNYFVLTQFLRLLWILKVCSSKTHCLKPFLTFENFS